VTAPRKGCAPHPRATAAPCGAGKVEPGIWPRPSLIVFRGPYDTSRLDDGCRPVQNAEITKNANGRHFRLAAMS
jgi:hypothetical protein